MREKVKESISDEVVDIYRRIEMRKWIYAILAALPLAVAGGMVYAKSQAKASPPQQAGSYVCPITGEELPCPKCCPLNQRK
jgi:hypothetical protein